MSETLERPVTAGAPPVADGGQEYGGSARAIQYHYDVGRDFYALWLDPSMTYSCAIWDGGDDLASAQCRKIDYHIDQARAAMAQSFLDVGCGWGGVLRHVAGLGRAEHAVGLTLSEDQAAAVRGMALRNTDVRLESWTQHEPVRPYDSIISVGAFEHFAKPEDAIAEKIATYRHFFKRCRDWLTPDGRMSLQTISYGSMTRDQASDFINNEIFPAADLPTLDEIATAAQGVLEIVQVRNDRHDYGRTFEQWARNLYANRARAVALVGEETVDRYSRYLKQSSLGFHMGKLGLLRLTLRPIRPSWAAMSRR